MKSKFEELTKQISKEKLQECYFDESLTLEEIYEQLNVSEYLLHRLLNYYNIPVRKFKVKHSTERQDNFKRVLEQIDKEQFINDYLNKNMSYLEIGKKYNCASYLDDILVEFNCKKPTELSRQLSKETLIDKHGDLKKAYQEGYKKAKVTLEHKYGSVDNFYKDREVKSNGTRIKHFGDLESYHRHRDTKAKETIKEKYGSVEDCYKQAAIKSKETLITHYGDLETAYRLSYDKGMETLKQKYGEDLTQFYKNKYNKNVDTKIEHYGSLEEAHKQASIKCVETKRINKTFNTSKPEDNYYEYLKTIFDETDIIRQYKDDRYPFACDFYIKSLDLFIECNYSWTHGGHLFNPNSEEDQQTLAEWQKKAETSDFYKKAIETWTVRDVKKYQTAKQNNLNYEVIY